MAVTATLVVLALSGWGISVLRHNVTIVDSLWSLFVFGAALTFALTGPTGPRASLVLTLAAIWALRLTGYLTWRNHGQPEDRRYRAIRERNEPGFRWKSLYLVFGLQAALAAIIALPLLGAIAAPRPLGILDAIGVLLWLTGFAFEAIGDWQLARFKADPRHRGRVMAGGLWRYTRHPNYFGECCLWWGFFVIALAGGAWWSLVSPLLMTVLLLKISGVALLERDIAERRPEYRDYAMRTPAFLPWFPRTVERAR